MFVMMTDVLISVIAVTSSHAGYLHYFWVWHLLLGHHISMSNSLHNIRRERASVIIKCAMAILTCRASVEKRVTVGTNYSGFCFVNVFDNSVWMLSAAISTNQIHNCHSLNFDKCNTLSHHFCIKNHSVSP